MMKNFLLVGIGGFFGSTARYFVSWLFSKNIGVFPVSTFIVNILGCFLIGAIYAFTEEYQRYYSEVRLLLATGFCGGFTTFSAFASENLSLIQKGEYFLFLFYTLASIILAIIAVYSGILLMKALK